MTDDTVTQLSKDNHLSKRYKQAKDTIFGTDNVIRLYVHRYQSMI